MEVVQCDCTSPPAPCGMGAQCEPPCPPCGGSMVPTPLPPVGMDLYRRTRLDGRMDPYHWGGICIYIYIHTYIAIEASRHLSACLRAVRGRSFTSSFPCQNLGLLPPFPPAERENRRLGQRHGAAEVSFCSFVLAPWLRPLRPERFTAWSGTMAMSQTVMMMMVVLMVVVARWRCWSTCWRTWW